MLPSIIELFNGLLARQRYALARSITLMRHCLLKLVSKCPFSLLKFQISFYYWLLIQLFCNFTTIFVVEPFSLRCRRLTVRNRKLTLEFTIQLFCARTQLNQFWDHLRLPRELFIFHLVFVSLDLTHITITLRLDTKSKLNNSHFLSTT